MSTIENILTTAKKSFYINGFKNVSISQICQESGIKLGTMTYYFKKKEDLVIYFYNHYMQRIFEFVRDNTNQLDPAKEHIYMIMLLYFTIYRDCNTERFHNEVLENTSMYNILYNQRE